MYSRLFKTTNPRASEPQRAGASKIPERNEPDSVTPPPRSSSVLSQSRKTGRDPVRSISDEQKATIVAKVRVKAAPIRKGPPYISAEVFVFQAGS